VHKLRHSAGLSIGIHTGKNTGSLGQDYACLAAFERVGMLDAGAGQAGTSGDKVEFFVVEGRPAVLAGKLGDDEKDACLFEVAVGKAINAEQFGSAHFKPDRIYGVMDHAGLVGVAVAGDDFDGMGLNFAAEREIHRFHLIIRASGFYSHSLVYPVNRPLNGFDTAKKVHQDKAVCNSIA